MHKIIILLVCIYCICTIDTSANETTKQMLPTDLGEEPATVLIALLVRNKAHVLPYVLTYLEHMDYPKKRLALWIRTDHNSDASSEILELWLNKTSALYHSVDYVADNATQRHQNENSAYDWTEARFKHLIHLKDLAFAHAEQIWADYIFYLDADVLLTENKTLKHLTSLQLPIVAPMLLSEGLYSNFWCGMTEEYYYLRTDEYREIYNVDKEGVFAVPMVHTAVLINLNYVGARYLTFDRERLIEQQQNDLEWSMKAGRQCRLYDGPLDDIIVFAISANCSQIPLFVTNELSFGYILQPLEPTDTVAQDLLQMVNIKTNIIHDSNEVQKVNDYFIPYTSYPEKHKLTLDQIYMINLKRRPNRRRKMENLFVELGLDVEYFEAVDGKKLNETIIEEMGIKFLPGYEDPYHHRQMTMGEIGCFLSHYKIWQEIVKKGYKEVLILEDDIRFEPYFKEQAERVLEQARNVVEYDLIYFGRKRLKDEKEPWVANAENLVHVGYSYWTLAYVITQQGARKLIAAKPLEKLLPVDEFLPIMFNRHPNETWSAAYKEHNLIAFSAAPLLLYPIHYTGDAGYVSDTEESTIITEARENYNSAKQYKSDRAEIFPNDYADVNQLEKPAPKEIKLTTKDLVDEQLQQQQQQQPNPEQLHLDISSDMKMLKEEF